jgi:hypothetical protein
LPKGISEVYEFIFFTNQKDAPPTKEIGKIPSQELLWNLVGGKRLAVRNGRHIIDYMLRLSEIKET